MYYQRGQSLIILVLMIALIVTVVTATSYRLTTETESTKVQEESVRALAGADAGIDAGLRYANEFGATINSIVGLPFDHADINLNIPGIDPARSLVRVTDTSAQQFLTGPVAADQQYTFYLRRYSQTAPYFTGANFTQPIDLFFGSGGVGDCNGPNQRPPAVEVSVLYGYNAGLPDPTVRRFLIDACPNASAKAIPGGGLKRIAVGANTTINGVNFRYRWRINPASPDFAGILDYNLLIIRPIFTTTEFALASLGPPLPSQGKEVRAEAYSYTGPSKIVTVLQSLPQIPADFFVTSF